MSCHRRLAPRALARACLLALAPLAAGCQFFFPMPVEPEVELEGKADAIRNSESTFEQGELLIGKVFVEDVAAGSVSLSVGKKCLADGKLALPLQGQGQVGGLLSLFGSGTAQTSALLDVDANLPLEASWDYHTDDKRSFVELDYAPGRYRFHQLRESADKKPAHSRKVVSLSTEQTPHDGHSMLGYLRRWDQPEGTRGFLYVVVGRNLYRADVTLSGRERLVTVLGEKEAVRIDGAATRLIEKTLEPSTRHKPRPFSIWLTDDEDRVPLRIAVTTELAEITIDLEKRELQPVSAGEPVACAQRVDKDALAKPARKKEKTIKPPPRRLVPKGKPRSAPEPEEADPAAK